GLAHQEGRRLQYVHHARDLVHRRVLVHVGQHRHADLPLHLAQHAQALLHARPAERGSRGAVGLVEAGLEDEVDAERRGDLLQLTGHVELQLLALDHARAGDQEKRLVAADLESTEVHRRALFCHGFAHAVASFSSFPPALRSRAARTKPMNSGWPPRGVDRNSGCAWQAMNHGWSASSTISTSRSSIDLALITRPASSSWVR